MFSSETDFGAPLRAVADVVGAGVVLGDVDDKGDEVGFVVGFWFGEAIGVAVADAVVEVIPLTASTNASNAGF